VPLDGAYGVDGVCLTAPVALTAGGATRVLEWRVTDDERAGIAAAATAVAAACEELAVAEAVGGAA
jgi:malate/lactate dehydrogenase